MIVRITRNAGRGYVTVRQFRHIPVPPSEFVTVTSRLPVVASGLTTRATVMVVEVLPVTVQVRPSPEKATWAPDANPVPFTLTVGTVPLDTDAGDTDVGFGPTLTVRQFAHLASYVPARLTTMSRLPAGASAAASTVTLIRVELTNVLDVIVRPVPDSDTTVAAVKPVPLTPMARPVAPWPMVFGDGAVTVIGLRGFTVTELLRPVLPALSDWLARRVYDPLGARPATLAIQVPPDAVVVSVCVGVVLVPT